MEDIRKGDLARYLTDDAFHKSIARLSYAGRVAFEVAAAYAAGAGGDALDAEAAALRRARMTALGLAAHDVLLVLRAVVGPKGERII